jgi:hypothetical protein
MMRLKHLQKNGRTEEENVLKYVSVEKGQKVFQRLFRLKDKIKT